MLIMMTPQLFARLCLAHIGVLRAFDIVSLYNTWLKIDESIGLSTLIRNCILTGILTIYTLR